MENDSRSRAPSSKMGKNDSGSRAPSSKIGNNDSRSKWKVTLGRELRALNRPNDESSAKSWKDSGSIGDDSSGLAGSGPKGK